MHFLGFLMSVLICGFGQTMRTVEIKNCPVISCLDIKLLSVEVLVRNVRQNLISRWASRLLTFRCPANSRKPVLSFFFIKTAFQQRSPQNIYHSQPFLRPYHQSQAEYSWNADECAESGILK